MSAVDAWVRAALATAMADVAEQGFAIPRVRIVFAGPASEISSWTLPPTDPEYRDEWFVGQLVGGRQRAVDALREQGPAELPSEARIIAAYMERLPVGLHASAFTGAHVEVWRPGVRRALYHCALPYVVNESSGKPSLLTNKLHVLAKREPNTTMETTWTKPN